MLLYVLGLGSPTHPLPADSFDAWTGTYQWENLYDVDEVMLVSVTSRSDGADEEAVFFLGKENFPLAYSKPKDTAILALQPLHVSRSGSGEGLHLPGDSLPSWPIEP